jgi:hypothetical protein
MTAMSTGREDRCDRGYDVLFSNVVEPPLKRVCGHSYDQLESIIHYLYLTVIQL